MERTPVELGSAIRVLKPLTLNGTCYGFNTVSENGDYPDVFRDQVGIFLRDFIEDEDVSVIWIDNKLYLMWDSLFSPVYMEKNNE